MLIKPKKSLGQNYLIDNNILNLMADIGEIKNDDIVLEVGPGTGNLTEKLLLKKPKKIILIEKDKNLSNNLKSLRGMLIPLYLYVETYYSFQCPNGLLQPFF